MDKPILADNLLKTLNQRYAIAQAFTKDFHDEVKRNINDYEAKSGDKKTVAYNRHISKTRYDLTIPYIFATHESMTSSFFENLPDIMITGRTSEAGKSDMIKAIYEYFKDKADLDEFLNVSAWWFFLTGFVKADIDWEEEVEFVPQLDTNGQPMIDEQGKEVNAPHYKTSDPVVSVDNILKIVFSPESEFSIDGKKVPYYIKEKLVDVDEIKETYGVEIDADQEIEVDGVGEKDSSDLKRAKMLYYYGTLPSSLKDDLKKHEEDGVAIEWVYGQVYKIYFVKDKVLLIESIDDKPCKLARFYTTQIKFFGFGIGKTLRPFQEDMSIRRGQQIAYADRFAFPWLTLPNGVKVDPKSMMDYEKRIPLTYSTDGGKGPEYLTPPNMPTAVIEADNANRSDAQFVSGTLDLSKGAQNTNTVKTATGQQLFAQSQDKRLNKARKALAKYYREVVIQMFKDARDKWSDEKTIYYPSEDGDDKELIVSKEDLQDIDFDTEIDFNLDSVSVNKDTESQRWLTLLETSAQLPFADTQKIYKKALKESFRIENPEFYIKEEQPPELPPDVNNPVDNQTPPVDNPEQLPSEQLLGSEMAPQAPYVG